MLAPALGRHRSHRSLHDLEQSLLDAFARHIPGDRRVLALAGHLVDLVDVDDPGLSSLDIPVRGLDQLEQDVLDVLAHVAGFRQRRGVGDGKGHVEHPGKGLRQEGLAASGRAQQQDVGLGQLNCVLACARGGVNPLVVVVHRHRQALLGRFLTDDVLIEKL